MLINHALYERQLAELELLQMLAESEDDVIKDHVFDAQEVLDDL